MSNDNCKNCETLRAQLLESQANLNFLRGPFSERSAKNDAYSQAVRVCEKEYVTNLTEWDNGFNAGIRCCAVNIETLKADVTNFPPTTTQDVIAKARNEALEEAAEVCNKNKEPWKDDSYQDACYDCVRDIRALKTEVK